MSRNTTTEDFGNYLYSRLPEFYKNADIEEGNTLLRRFIDSMHYGGFEPTETLSVGLLDLSQISKCPEEYLDTIGHSFGVDWIRDVKSDYKRRILKTIIDLYKIKGSKNSVEHLARSISGFNVEVREGVIPDADFEPGDEKKRLTTIQLYSPHFDDYDPSKTDMDLDTIKYVMSYFVPVHTKFVVILTYFYEEIYGVSTSTRMLHKAHINNNQGIETKTFNNTVSDTNSMKVKDTYYTNLFPVYAKEGRINVTKLTPYFRLSPFLSDIVDGYEHFNLIKRNEGSESYTLDVEEHVDFNLNLQSEGDDKIIELEDESSDKINHSNSEVCDIIKLKEVHFTPRLSFKESKLNTTGLILTPRNELDICKVTKNGITKIIYI